MNNDIDNMCGPKKIQKNTYQMVIIKKKSHNQPTLINTLSIMLDKAPTSLLE